MEKWTLSNLPPEGHQDVARWFWDNCYMVSEAEKERLGMPDRWRENYRMWRGGAGKVNLKSRRSITANLMFSNVNRTVANLTAKNPSAEVVSLDGGYQVDPETGEALLDQKGNPLPDDADKKVTTKMKKWWGDTEQVNVLVDSALQMEIYGTTIEKGIYNSSTDEADTITIDPFAVVVAPGNWLEPNDSPYFGMAQAMRPDAVESMFGLEPGVVNTDDCYSILGEDREDLRPTSYGTNHRSSAASSNYGGKTLHPRTQRSGGEDRALVVELFVRDNTTVDSTGPDGQPILDESGQPVKIKKYPGGIRVVTICNGGDLLCFDGPNPNVNPELTREEQSNIYLFDHYPYSWGVSYRDTTTHWGIAAAEQAGDLADKISEILQRMFQYFARCLTPVLILPTDTGLTEDDVSNAPGLVLTPRDGESGNGIRFLAVPNLPSDFFRVLETIMAIFDRIYQIEDADRGDTPNRVVAASAIVALQERNQVVMRHKIRQVDFLIRQRGRWAISFFQNFGVTTDTIKVDDKVTGIRGLDFIGRNFQYLVESGSTITQTSLQVQEQAIDLADKGHIDSEALLEALNFPNRNRIIERMAEKGSQIEQAAAVFIQAGVDEQTMADLVAYAQQPQFGQQMGA